MNSLVTRLPSLVTAFCILHSAFCIALLSTATAADSSAFGVCEHVAWSVSAGGEYENRTTVFDRAASAGIGWVRCDIRWDYCVNRDNGNWSWWQIDEVFSSAESRGIQLLPILCGKNPLTNAEAQNDLDGWEAFAREFTSRYKGRFSAVEIWNEPDNTTFWNISAANFKNIMQRAYTAIKAVDPTITVVLGGVTAGGTDYLSSLYSNGVKNYCDVVAYHPYVWPHAPDEEWRTGNILSGYTYRGFIRYINAVKSVMSSNGDGSKPLWLTEVGWPSGGNNGVSEAQQASYVTNAAAIAFANGVEKFFVYELKAPETSSSDIESHFGIMHTDYTFKPAYLAYRDYIVRKESGAADPYANAVFLIAGDNWDTQSFATAGNWSDGLAPHSGTDYLVASLAPTGLWMPLSGDTTFGGRSLAVGRVGGLSGQVRNIGWGNTITIGSLALNRGRWRVAVGGDAATGMTVAGSATVNAPASEPFVFAADALEENKPRFFTLASTLSGAAGTALRFVADGDSSLLLTVSGDTSAYAGEFILDGGAVTGRFSNAALAGPSGAGAVTFQSGAVLAPTTNGQRLSGSSRTLASDGTGRITVADGSTFTLAAPVSGIFRKTGAGTLVLDGDMTGNGRIAVQQGVVRVDIDTAQYISAIEGGQVVYCVPAGSLNSAQSIATVTVPGPLSTGDVVVSDGAAAPGWIATVRYESDGQGHDTAYIDVTASSSTDVGTDSFEGPAVGTAASSLSGWTGDGAVATGTPDIGNPPGVPLPNETHAQVLALYGDATRTYANGFARDNQSVDMLVQVKVAVDANWRTRIAQDATAQLRLAFDETGHAWALHGDASSSDYVWSRLGRELANGAGSAEHDPYPNNGWIRVSVDFDYTTAAPAAYAQIRIEGHAMRAADGAAAPGAAPTGGTWLRLPNTAAAAGKISSVTFSEAGAVDDLVHRYHAVGTAPDFAPFGGTDLGGIPRSWFDANGITRDPSSDPDGDDFANIREWRKGTDPADIGSHPPYPTTLILR